MSSILADLQAVRRAAELGEALDTELLDDALGRLPQEGPDLPRSELLAIQGEVDRIFELAEEQRDTLAEHLEQLHKGRSAIQGYNHLQAFHTAQRLSKRA